MSEACSENDVEGGSAPWAILSVMHFELIECWASPRPLNVSPSWILETTKAELFVNHHDYRRGASREVVYIYQSSSPAFQFDYFSVLFTTYFFWPASAPCVRR